MYAAAELAEVPTMQLMKAAEDFQDGTVDTEEGRLVFGLFQEVGGRVLLMEQDPPCAIETGVRRQAEEVIG